MSSIRKEIYSALFEKYKSSKDIPKQIEVDSETYGEICNEVFLSKCNALGNLQKIEIYIGPAAGIMYKNIEFFPAIVREKINEQKVSNRSKTNEG